MPRAPAAPKDETFNFRLDPALKAALLEAAEAEARPAGEILRELIRAFVAHRRRSTFAAEARRQSRLIAAAAADPSSDEARLLDALAATFDELVRDEDWR